MPVTVRSDRGCEDHLHHSVSKSDPADGGLDLLD